MKLRDGTVAYPGLPRDVEREVREERERLRNDRCRRAMKEGLAGTDAYLAHWQWSERQERPGDPQAVLAAVVRDLEGSYDERDRRA